MSVVVSTLRLNGVMIESRSSDKFINATQMCKAGGKKFNDWYKINTTKELIKTLNDDLNVNAKIFALKLIDKKVGGSHSGSWIHPDLAVQLAQWISPSFAIQVSRWIRELFLTGNVSINSNKSDEELKELQQKVLFLEAENKQKDLVIEDKNAALNRLHNTQKELLSYKKRMSKDETIYIVSTKNYARQGIYKIGRTKNKMKLRSSGHNTTHIAGDKVKVLREFKVNDATLVERNIHTKLNGLLINGEKEFFMCPFNQLSNIVGAIVRNDDEENEIVNSIIELVYSLKNRQFSHLDWMVGIPEDTFAEVLTIQQGNQVPVVLDISNWTTQHKKDFIDRCVQEYVVQQNKVDQEYQMCWKTLQQYIFAQLSTQLTIPRSKFKVNDWKPFVKDCVGDKENLSIKWRG